MNRRIFAIPALAMVLLLPSVAKAQVSVIDWASIQRLYEEVQLAQSQLTQMTSTVHALTSIPAGMVRQVEGLLTLGVQNPLGDIQGTLSSLMNGGTLTGTCASAAGEFTSLNRYSSAIGGDFGGAMINSSSARLGGVMSCLQTMTRSTQSRLNQMPQLLDELQACQDVSCTTAVSGRINLETATIGAQTNQAILMGQTAQIQRWTAEDQAIQKMRSDAEATAAGASGGVTPNGSPPLTAGTPEAPSFTVGGGG